MFKNILKVFETLFIALEHTCYGHNKIKYNVALQTSSNNELYNKNK